MSRLLPLGLLLLALAAPVAAFADDPMTAAQIISALTPKKGDVRGLKVETATPSANPSIDMRVGFEAGSANLDTEAILSLKALGTALRDPRLKGYAFQIVGHTDGRGSALTNMAMSKQRAQAVVTYLVDEQHVSELRLLAIGKGETEPLNADDPDAPENGRVEIVNIGE